MKLAVAIFISFVHAHTCCFMKYNQRNVGDTFVPLFHADTMEDQKRCFEEKHENPLAPLEPRRKGTYIGHCGSWEGDLARAQKYSF